MNDNGNNNLPDFISVVQMAKYLNLSRSRFYQLIDENIFLKPVYLLTNKRPIYTREMAINNINAKKNNVGINGKIIMFYASRNKTINPINRDNVERQITENKNTENKYSDLIDDLENLGLEDIYETKIESAVKEIFPDGTENIDEDEILTSVFRHIKCRNTTDNVAR